MNPLINNDFHPHYMFEHTHSKQSTHHQAVWIKVTWWLCSHRVICRNRTYFLFYVTFSQLHRTMRPILFQSIYFWFPWKTAHNASALNFVLNKQYPPPPLSALHIVVIFSTLWTPNILSHACDLSLRTGAPFADQGPALLTLKSFYLKAFSRKHGCDWLMLKHQPITATLSAKSF